MESDCVFCDYEKIKEGIIYETPDLLVKIPFAIPHPGHVMVIPRKHLVQEAGLCMTARFPTA